MPWRQLRPVSHIELSGSRQVELTAPEAFTWSIPESVESARRGQRETNGNTSTWEQKADLLLKSQGPKHNYVPHRECGYRWLNEEASGGDHLQNAISQDISVAVP